MVHISPMAVCALHSLSIFTIVQMFILYLKLVLASFASLLCIQFGLNTIVCHVTAIITTCY